MKEALWLRENCLSQEAPQSLPIVAWTHDWLHKEPRVQLTAPELPFWNCPWEHSLLPLLKCGASAMVLPVLLYAEAGELGRHSWSLVLDAATATAEKVSPAKKWLPGGSSSFFASKDRQISRRVCTPWFLAFLVRATGNWTSDFYHHSPWVLIISLLGAHPTLSHLSARTSVNHLINFFPFA
jgi:hypothetical protein